jgi:hypothetical protein
MFASNKIVSLLLYIVFGISILIVAFFYFGENLIDEAAYNAKVTKLETSVDPQTLPERPDMAPEEIIADTLVTADTAAPPPPVVIVPPVVSPEEINFTFMERLIYYKTDIALGWAYIMVGITLLLALIFPLFYMFSSTRSLIQTVGVLAIAAVLVGVAYLLSSDTPIYIPGFEGTDNSNPGVLKFVDTAMFTTYFLIGLALISILFSEVVRYFK